MKVERGAVPAFKPITITLESEHEAQCLQTILNHSHSLWKNIPYSYPNEGEIEEVSSALWGMLDQLNISACPTEDGSF